MDLWLWIVGVEQQAIGASDRERCISQKIIFSNQKVGKGTQILDIRPWLW